MARPEWLKDVEITEHVEDGRKEFIITPVWEGVDRARAGSLVATSMAVALRCKAAFEEGAALFSDGVKADVNGKTYVDFRWTVRARCLNADLRRLGY